MKQDWKMILFGFLIFTLVHVGVIIIGVHVVRSYHQ